MGARYYARTRRSCREALHMMLHREDLRKRCAGARVTVRSDTDTDSDSSTESEDDHSLRIDNLDWCSCRCSTTRVYLCSTMQTAEECICCREIPILQYIMEKSNCSCITETHGFIVNCLDADVLTVSFYEYSELNGPIGDEEPVHEARFGFFSQFWK
ncbi:uncharacterized protein LOC141912259 [Tubulanus polymorphus]|uniref:uncharacterized protein LOC141912259 n=1 Tax=Tubulanus polymorphus TaxID=672921 RepID=UPI003DA24F02